MKRTIISVVVALMLTGCGDTHTSMTGGSQPVLPPNQPVTFFEHAANNEVKITLHPDPAIMKDIPNVTPPKRPVVVYLPAYPGAKSVKPVAGIGDMGTPIDGDAVDGALYFSSKDTEAKIKAWYAEQFRKLGYSINGHGDGRDYKKVTTEFFGFTKNGLPVDPTQNPEIDLGFLTQKEGHQTIFKIKAMYIVSPPRPIDTYLPSDVVKVVLTKGNVTKTITDINWISNVVHLINGLQVSTPGMSVGAAASNETVTTINAKFYRKGGTAIEVTYSPQSATVKVGNSDVSLNSGPSPTFYKSIESVFTN